jgi:hypothetical protein
MRASLDHVAQKRITHPKLGYGDSHNGCLRLDDGPTVIFSRNADWEHVSVSLPDRCPTWAEMQFWKEMFWSDSETVMQLHPSKDRYVNNHPFCLHLWRPRRGMKIPVPPMEFV